MPEQIKNNLEPIPQEPIKEVDKKEKEFVLEIGTGGLSVLDADF